MRIVATSDLHGSFVDIPLCDVLIVAGDVCPLHRSHDVITQLEWMREDFSTWLKKWRKQASHIVWIAGNHDFVCQEPPFEEWAEQHLPEATYLQDKKVEIESLVFYGSPWVHNLPNWAFNCEEPEMSLYWMNIPDYTDVLITHGPPTGIGDQAQGRYHVGSSSLANRVREVSPKLHVFGHIHEGYGKNEDFLPITFANVAHNDRSYRAINPPLEFEI